MNETMEQINIVEGRRLRDHGIRMSSEHADRIEPRWQDRAYEILEQYAGLYPKFMAEDVRHYAHSIGLPKPPDGRAWGAIIRRGVKNNIMTLESYAPMKSKNCHCDPKPVWRSLLTLP